MLRLTAVAAAQHVAPPTRHCCHCCVCAHAQHSSFLHPLRPATSPLRYGRRLRRKEALEEYITLVTAWGIDATAWFRVSKAEVRQAKHAKETKLREAAEEAAEKVARRIRRREKEARAGMVAEDKAGHAMRKREKAAAIAARAARLLKQHEVATARKQQHALERNRLAKAHLDSCPHELNTMTDMVNHSAIYLDAVVKVSLRRVWFPSHCSPCARDLRQSPTRRSCCSRAGKLICRRVCLHSPRRPLAAPCRCDEARHYGNLPTSARDSGGGVPTGAGATCNAEGTVDPGRNDGADHQRCNGEKELFLRSAHDGGVLVAARQ